MRLSLVHNPTAGHGRYVREELLVGLQRAGHSVHVCVDDVEGGNLDHLLNDPGDAIVVGGGDGSVQRVARRIVGRGVPLAVLPIGTANNIARALHLPQDPLLVIAQLNAMVPWEFDVGCITGPWGRNLFLEGTGFGPFVRTALLLSHPSQKEVFDRPEAELARDRHILKAMIRDYVSQACEIELDDETLTGNYVAVEIMNLPTVGPRLVMAPGADPSDGFFDVVTVEDAARRSFTDLVAGEAKAGDLDSLPVRRSRAVRMHWQGAEIHIDDEFHQVGKPADLAATVAPGTLTFLRLPSDLRPGFNQP